MRKFKCEKCGSGNLAYKDYVDCIKPVKFKEDNTLDYLLPIIKVDTKKVSGQFCCADCRSEIKYRGRELKTGEVLLGYLRLSEEHLKQQQEFEKLFDRSSGYDWL